MELRRTFAVGIALTIMLILFGGCASAKPTRLPIELVGYSVGGCEIQRESEYSKTPGDENVDIELVDGFIDITHYLNYVCCAMIEVYLDPIETYSNYTIIKIKEKNQGEMCRCICDYVINTRLGPVEEGKYLIQIWGVEFENIPAEVIWEKEIEIRDSNLVLPPKPGEDFCGRSTYGKCLTDLDCAIGGCSGQICQSKIEEPVITTCEWKDCYDARAYGLECKCVNGQCQWYK